MTSSWNTDVELTTDEVGTLLFLLQPRINQLKKDIENPIYKSDLVEGMKKSLETATSIYLKITEKEELDF